MLLKYIAQKLAKTKLGQQSLEKSERIILFHEKPGLREYIGLLLFVLSFVSGVPTIALLGFISLKIDQPLIVVIGTPVVFITIHFMFALGIYLAGKNYAKDIFYWSTKRFLEKYGS